MVKMKKKKKMMVVVDPLFGNIPYVHFELSQ
jgi:hypothetical protein